MDIASLFSTPSAPTGNTASSNLLAGDAGMAVVNAEGVENFNRLLMSFLDQSSQSSNKTQSSIEKAASLFGEAATQTQGGTTTNATGEDATALTTGFNQLPRQVRAAVPDMRWQQAGLNLLAMSQSDGTPPPLSNEVTSFLNDLSALMRQQGLLSGKGAAAVDGEETSGTEAAKGNAVAATADGNADPNLGSTPLTTGVAVETASISITPLSAGTVTATKAMTTSAEAAANIIGDSVAPETAPVMGGQSRGLKPSIGPSAKQATTAEAAGSAPVPSAITAPEGKTDIVGKAPMAGPALSGNTLTPSPVGATNNDQSGESGAAITPSAIAATAKPDTGSPVIASAGTDDGKIATTGTAGEASAKPLSSPSAPISSAATEQTALAVVTSQSQDGKTGAIVLPKGMAPATPGDKPSAAASANNQPAAPAAKAVAADRVATAPAAATPETGTDMPKKVAPVTASALSPVSSDAEATTDKSMASIVATLPTGSEASNATVTPSTTVAAASVGNSTSMASVIATLPTGSEASNATVTPSTTVAAASIGNSTPPVSMAKGQDGHNPQPLNGMAKHDVANKPASKAENTATVAATNDTLNSGDAEEQPAAASAKEPLSFAAEEPENKASDAPTEAKSPPQPQMIEPTVAEAVPLTTVAALDRETVITGEAAGTKTEAAPLASVGRDKPAATGSRPQAPAASAGTPDDTAANVDNAASADSADSADSAVKEATKEGGKPHRMLAPQHTDPENAAHAVADQTGERPQATARPTNGNIGSPANNAVQDNLMTRAVGASSGSTGGELGSESNSGETSTLGTQDGSLSLAADGAKTGTTDFSQHLRQASAPAGSQRPGATPTATYQVALQVQRATQDGNDRISIQLRPYDLGRVDVQLEFNNDGKLRAKVTADSIQTLELLQKDSRNLERALQEAGLSTDQGSLSFSLRDDGDQAQRQQQNNQQEKKSGTRLANIEVEEEMPAVPAYRPVIGPGRVDVRI